jgi:agmatinase
MKSFAYADASFADADAVLFGVPDESGSQAPRSGSRHGPNAIRRVSREHNIYGPGRYVESQRGGDRLKLHDAGNLRRRRLAEYTRTLCKAGKIPVMLGGDHSLTAEAFKGLVSACQPNLVYFDAHPDCIASERNYFGSVIPDIFDLPGMKNAVIVQVGIRAPEAEEFRTTKERNVRMYTAWDVEELGAREAVQEIRKLVKEDVYLSVDLDAIDPAFAPGVSTPYPGGLSAREAIYMVSQLARLGLAGLDIMEYVPRNDIQDMTAQLATAIIAEALAAAKRG